MMDINPLYQQCRSLVPLGTMRPHHLSAALQDATEITGCQGDVIFERGHPTSSIYYLLSGEVRLTHISGRERIITADFHWFPIVQFQVEEFTAVALTDFQVVAFNYEQLDNLLTWSQVADYLEIDISYERKNDENAQWMNTILNSNLFYKIPPLNALKIFSKVTSIEVSDGDEIITQGSDGEYCYFIKEGKAKVTRTEPQKEPVLLAEVGMGRCFGEDALINKTTRNASVTMLSDGVLMRLHRDDFSQLLFDSSQRFVKTQSLDEALTDHIQFLDVRTQEEFDYRHFVGALHIPLRLLRLKVRLLDPDIHYVVYCNSGSRSHAAAYLLTQKDIKVTVLKDGLRGLTQEQVDENLIDEFEEFHRLAVS